MSIVLDDYAVVGSGFVVFLDLAWEGAVILHYCIVHKKSGGRIPLTYPVNLSKISVNLSDFIIISADFLTYEYLLLGLYLAGWLFGMIDSLMIL